MQEGVQEPVRMILLTFLIVLLINIFGISFRVNQINEYQRRMEQDIQANGGVTKTVQDDGDILSKNVYHNMFELQPYPNDPNSAKVNDYGKQVRYQIKVFIPFLFYSNKFQLHYIKKGQVASQYSMSQQQTGAKVKPLVKLDLQDNANNHLTDTLAKSCITNLNDLPDRTRVQFAYHNYQNNNGEISEKYDDKTNKAQIRDSHGNYYWINTKTNQLYSYTQPKKKINKPFKPGHYQATIRITYPPKPVRHNENGQNQDFEWGTTDEVTVNLVVTN